jgi:2-oxoglutarate dehydrogenase E1 component
MPHRGRLNVLTNIAGKSYAQVFREFEGDYGDDSVQGSGDVKYHLGTTGSFLTPEGAYTSVYIAANPSHLEAVDPVLEGIVRAKQDLLPKERRTDILPVLVHGDAAFAGQGVVAETLNLSQLQGYRTGGTVHVVVNNQVGFTTSPKYGRSSVYSTDVAPIRTSSSTWCATADAAITRPTIPRSPSRACTRSSTPSVRSERATPSL